MYLTYSASQLDEYAKILHEGGKVFITHMRQAQGVAHLIGAGAMDVDSSARRPPAIWAHEAWALGRRQGDYWRHRTSIPGVDVGEGDCGVCDGGPKPYGPRQGLYLKQRGCRCLRHAH